MYLNHDGLHQQAGVSRPLEISSPLTTGLMAGQWCPHGLDPDLSGDQRAESGGSLVFDSAALDDDIEILGAPIVELDLKCDRPQGLVATCLSEIMPDGAVTRVSYGLLNLSHRNSHEFPEALEPGKTYRVNLQLNEAGHRFARGHRIRVAISSNYWPIAWPSPEKTTLGLSSATSLIKLPCRLPDEADALLSPFQPAESAPLLDKTVERPADYRWTIEQDMVSGKSTMNQWFDEGRIRYNEHDGWTVESMHDEYFTIHPDDPNSASFKTTWTELFERGDWQISTRTHTHFTSTATEFIVEADLEAREGEEIVHQQSWKQAYPRNNM